MAFINRVNHYLVYLCCLNFNYDTIFFKQHFFNFNARWQRVDSYHYCSIANVWR